MTRRTTPAILLCTIVVFTVTLSAGAQEQVSPHEVRTTKFTIGDVDPTTAFYENLVGMRELDRFIAGDSLVEPFMGFDEGAGRIGLLAFTTMETIEKSPHPISVLFVPDLDAVDPRFKRANHPI